MVSGSPWGIGILSLIRLYRSNPALRLEPRHSGQDLWYVPGPFCLVEQPGCFVLLVMHKSIILSSGFRKDRLSMSLLCFLLFPPSSPMVMIFYFAWGNFESNSFQARNNLEWILGTWMPFSSERTLDFEPCLMKLHWYIHWMSSWVWVTPDMMYLSSPRYCWTH